MFLFALVCGGTATASSPAFYTRGVAWDFREEICDSGQVLGPTAGCTQSLSFPVAGITIEGTASSSADLRSGDLAAGAVSAGYICCTGLEGQALATSELFDTLTFHGPLSGNAVITMSAAVAVSPPVSGLEDFGNGGAYIGLGALALSGQLIAGATDCTAQQVDSHFCTPVLQGAAVINNVGDLYTITVTLDLATHPTVALDLSAGAEAFGDATASVLDPIKITLPAGVTYTSASGLFLTSAVPEFPAWASMLAGLVVMGARVRRRGSGVVGAMARESRNAAGASRPPWHSAGY